MDERGIDTGLVSNLKALQRNTEHSLDDNHYRLIPIVEESTSFGFTTSDNVGPKDTNP